MENKDALKIIQALADGINPMTGEVLPSDSVYQSSQVTRALFIAVNAIEARIRNENRKGTLPENRGKPWSDNEDKELIEEFKNKKKKTEMARIHGRTTGAIQSRLVKLGKIEFDSDIA